MIPLWLYAVVVTLLCVALYVVTRQRDHAKWALTDHLAECTTPHHSDRDPTGAPRP